MCIDIRLARKCEALWNKPWNRCKGIYINKETICVVIVRKREALWNKPRSLSHTKTRNAWKTLNVQNAWKTLNAQNAWKAQNAWNAQNS